MNTIDPQCPASDKEQPERHCDHECVCTDYGLIPLWQKEKREGSCNIALCDHDTRSRPHTSTTELEEANRSLAAENIRLVQERDTLIQRTLDKFLKKIKAEDPQHLGYVDMDSIEAAYIRLRQHPTTGTTRPAKGKEGE